MTIRAIGRPLTLVLAGLALSTGVKAGTLSNAYDSCDAAIASELGSGKLRTSVLTNFLNDGAGEHWINVRHRADGDDQTRRYRAFCETRDGGRTADVTLEEGAWREARRNKTPIAVD